MTQEEFKRIHVFLKNKYGIDMSKKLEIVNGRLENYLRKNGFRNYSDYMNAVETDITGRLEKELVNMLTTNHTYFMREAEHFDYLKQVVLPYLKKKEEKTKDLAIWCGAASTGEEAYTLAMIMVDFFGLEHSKWDTKVLATDVSTEVLQHAVHGVYQAEQVEKIPLTWKRRFMKTDVNGEFYEMTREIKEEVIFRQFNLMEPFPFRRKMHIIFMRNVMIYFDGNTKKELLKKINDVLEPGGYLFIGRTETLDRDGSSLEMIQPSIFRKPEREKV